MGKRRAAAAAKRDAHVVRAAIMYSRIRNVAGKAWDAADKVGMDALKTAGVQIQPASPAFIAEVRSRTAPLANGWVQAANAKGLDGAKILAEFQEEIKRVAEGK